MKARLEINGIDFPFDNLLPISTNYSIADIREIDKRNSSSTKTISIPGTSVVNRFFENIFEVNTQLNSFNPNLKSTAKYFVNEVEIFNGFMQLERIIKLKGIHGDQVTYECCLRGNDGNIYFKIYDKFLTDLDCSDLNHAFTFNPDLMINPPSGSPSIGTGNGYCYPLIDYGQNGGQARDWYWKYLKPAIYEREYLQRIFYAAGYYWSSDYLDSSEYCNIVIPNNEEGSMKMSQTAIDNAQVCVKRSTANGYSQSGTVGGATYIHTRTDVVPLDDTTTPPYYDIGSNWNAINYYFVQPFAGSFSFVANLGYTVTMTTSNTYTSVSHNVIVGITIQRYNGVSWVNMATNIVSSTETTMTFTSYVSVLLNATSQPLPSYWRVQSSWTITSTYFNGGTPQTGGTSSGLFVYNTNSDFKCSLASTDLPEGSTVEMNDLIPKNVRQIDFLTSIIKCENLYLEPHKYLVNRYKIEPRDEFIDFSSHVDWTGKVDISQPITIVPMGELNWKRNLFKYKEDSDHFNKLYQDEFKEPYGTQTLDYQSDFLTDIHTTEVIFSATPMAQISVNYSSPVVAPRFFKQDNGVFAPTAVNIRRLFIAPNGANTYYLTLHVGYGTFTGAYSFGGYTLRPYCGHLDNPFSGTVDLCFGTPKKIYYDTLVYPNSSRYNVRYFNLISEITNAQSKIVRMSILLDENDIKKFSFRTLVFIEDAYYVVNKIEGYDPQDYKPITVELLKLNSGVEWTPESISTGGGSGSALRVALPFNQNGNYGVNVYGSNNVNYEQNTIVFGNNNTVL